MKPPSRAKAFRGSDRPLPPPNAVKSLNGRMSVRCHENIDRGVAELDAQFKRWAKRRHKFEPMGKLETCDKCNLRVEAEIHI